MRPAACFALLTDYGYEDAYAGILRGVLTGLAPSIPILDICHSIPAGDIRRAALMLWQALPHFPEGTVFLAIVDPGVGGDRLPILRQSERCAILCPDNGISFFAALRHPAWQNREIRNRKFMSGEISRTFHGRDVFAPAAGYLARGAAADAFGPPVKDLRALPMPLLSGNPSDGWEGEVMYHDHFGNAVTSIGAFTPDGSALDAWLPGTAQSGPLPGSGCVQLEDGSLLPLRSSYNEAGAGPAAIIGSSGWMEIAVQNGRAADRPMLQVGSRIRFLPSH